MRKVGVAAVAVSLGVLAAAAIAQEPAYPKRGNIELTVLFPGGTSADITARLLAQGITKHTGANIVVVNRPGAGGAVGGRRRWKTMPWIVVFFGLAVGPLGLISVMLVVFQPVLFDAWCTLCLVTAFISIVMIGPSMDEVLASLQYLKRAKESGKSLWRAFWGYKDVVNTVK